MASSLHKLLSTLVFLATVLSPTSQQECPYPCYPPPTGPGNNPPVTTTPPAPPVSTTPPASFSPPVTTAPPAGFLPFTPPPPYFFGVTPPPPEPMLGWFPFYYRRPAHQEQSSSTPLGGSRIFIFVFPLFVVIFSFVFN